MKEWLPGPSGGDVARVACVDVARNRRDTVEIKTVQAMDTRRVKSTYSIFGVHAVARCRVRSVLARVQVHVGHCKTYILQ